MFASGFLRRQTWAGCGLLSLVFLCGSPLLLHAAAPNPSSLSASPTGLTMPGTVRFCANGGANMTVDLKYLWEGVLYETDYGVTFDSTGCVDNYYDSDSFAGSYIFKGIRNSLNGPSGAWTNIYTPLNLYPQPSPPTISYFYADQSTINIYQCTYLHWASENATSADLSGDYVATAYDQQVCPTSTTQYVLSAHNDSGQTARAFYTIHVNTQVNDAVCVGQSTLPAMDVGKTYTVYVTMKNTGTTTWSEAQSYRLGSQNLPNNTTWGMSRVSLASGETVVPGATKTFTFTVTALTTPGNYNFQWQMIRDGVGWFGNPSLNQSTPSKIPQPTSMSFNPTQMNAGNGNYTLTVGNGKDMSLDFQYTLNAPDEPQQWCNPALLMPESGWGPLDANGTRIVVVNHDDPRGPYRFCKVKNSVATEWVTLSPPAVFTILDPQPKANTLTLEPSFMQPRLWYKMSADNASGITADTRYTRNGPEEPIHYRWPIFPTAASGSRGEVWIDARICTASGNYLFTGMKNTTQTEWVSQNTPATVICPLLPPAVKPELVGTVTAGTTATLTISGDSLCGPNLTLSSDDPGISFPGVWPDPEYMGSPVTATVVVAANVEPRDHPITVNTECGSAPGKLTVLPLPPAEILSVTPNRAKPGETKLISITGSNIRNGFILNPPPGFSFTPMVFVSEDPVTHIQEIQTTLTVAMGAKQDLYTIALNTRENVTPAKFSFAIAANDATQLVILDTQGDRGDGVINFGTFSLLGAVSAASGLATVTLQNLGTASLTLNSVTLVVAPGFLQGQCSVDGLCDGSPFLTVTPSLPIPTTLAANQSMTLTVQFNVNVSQLPKGGFLGSALQISSTDPGLPTATVMMSATVVAGVETAASEGGLILRQDNDELRGIFNFGPPSSTGYTLVLPAFVDPVFLSPVPHVAASSFTADNVLVGGISLRVFVQNLGGTVSPPVRDSNLNTLINFTIPDLQQWKAAANGESAKYAFQFKSGSTTLSTEIEVFGFQLACSANFASLIQAVRDCALPASTQIGNFDLQSLINPDHTLNTTNANALLGASAQLKQCLDQFFPQFHALLDLVHRVQDLTPDQLPEVLGDANQVIQILPLPPKLKEGIDLAVQLAPLVKQLIDAQSLREVLDASLDIGGVISPQIRRTLSVIRIITHFPRCTIQTTTDFEILPVSIDGGPIELQPVEFVTVTSFCPFLGVPQFPSFHDLLEGYLVALPQNLKDLIGSMRSNIPSPDSFDNFLAQGGALQVSPAVLEFFNKRGLNSATQSFHVSAISQPRSDPADPIIRVDVSVPDPQRICSSLAKRNLFGVSRFSETNDGIETASFECSTIPTTPLAPLFVGDHFDTSVFFNTFPGSISSPPSPLFAQEKVVIPGAGCVDLIGHIRPQITRFDVPGSIQLGQPGTIFWETLDAPVASLNGTALPTPSSGNTAISPTQDTTYTLTAFGSLNGGPTADINNTVTVQKTVKVLFPLRGSVINPPVADDGDATISGQTFTFQIEAIDSVTGQRATNVSGQVSIDFGTIRAGEVVPPAITLNQGVGTAQVRLVVVDGTSSGRTYSLQGSSGLTGSGFVNVWFEVTATSEFYRDCDGTLSYGSTTACSTRGLPQNTVFVALPARSDVLPCDTMVTVRTLGTITKQGSAPVKDRGPKTTLDPYWNNTGVPQFQDRAIDLSDAFASQLGLNPHCIGSTGVIDDGHIIWRFN